MRTLVTCKEGDIFPDKIVALREGETPLHAISTLYGPFAYWDKDMFGVRNRENSSTVVHYTFEVRHVAEPAPEPVTADVTLPLTLLTGLVDMLRARDAREENTIEDLIVMDEYMADLAPYFEDALDKAPETTNTD